MGRTVSFMPFADDHLKKKTPENNGHHEEVKMGFLESEDAQAENAGGTAYDELEEMLSPIASRNQVRVDDLDEIEEEVIEAIHEYRQKEIFNEFKNYKKYYQDAEK